MGEFVLDVGVLGPTVSAEEGLVGVLAYVEALVGVLEADGAVVVRAEAGASSSLRLDEDAEAGAAALVCLDGPMITNEAVNRLCKLVFTLQAELQRDEAGGTSFKMKFSCNCVVQIVPRRQGARSTDQVCDQSISFKGESK